MSNRIPDDQNVLIRILIRIFCFKIGGGMNSHEVVLNVSEMVIRESRAAHMQPFNQYRKLFGLKPYTSFQEFTGTLELRRN